MARRCVALIVLAAVAWPAGATGAGRWSQPLAVAHPVRPADVVDTVIAGGDAVVVWEDFDIVGTGRNVTTERFALWVASAAIGQPFGASRLLERTDGGPGAAVAASASGWCAVGWQSGRAIRVALRPPGGVFGAPVTVAEAVPAAPVRVGIDDSGTATVLWSELGRCPASRGRCAQRRPGPTVPWRATMSTARSFPVAGWRWPSEPGGRPSPPGAAPPDPRARAETTRASRCDPPVGSSDPRRPSPTPRPACTSAERVSTRPAARRSRFTAFASAARSRCPPTLAASRSSTAAPMADGTRRRAWTPTSRRATSGSCPMGVATAPRLGTSSRSTARRSTPRASRRHRPVSRLAAPAHPNAVDGRSHPRRDPR